MKAEVLSERPRDYSSNFLKYWETCRRNDSYVVYAAIPPAGIRAQTFGQNEARRDPGLKVVSERDDGVVISGMKMMATAAAYADEILISNFIPLAPEFKEYSITCAIPCDAEGLTLWSRQPYSEQARFKIDYPLSHAFDESDSVVVCENVKVPWERVFVHNDADLSRGCWVTSAANCFSNHQSNVRFWSKMSFLVGLASSVAEMSGNNKIPAVQETLGKLAAYEATIAAMVQGQIEGYEQDWPGGADGYVSYNRRYMYGALNWCQENHTNIIDTIRDLAGGNPLLMPANGSALRDPHLREVFEENFHTPFTSAIDRLKLLKIVWDLTGSEFAGRHQLYEKFYAGASFVVRNQSFREAPWDEFKAQVQKIMEDTTAPSVLPEAAQ